MTEAALDRDRRTPVIELRGISKYFGTVVALEDVSVSVHAGEVVCLLGDNGAGKSTLIKIMSGVFPPDAGQVLVDGEEVHFRFAHDARERGIATVFQDLAVMPLMSVTRNFFLGSELTTGFGWGPLRRFDRKAADKVAHSELLKMGIDLRDTSQLAGTLSGGERQSLAIARAIYFGARVVILDEPTSALGIKEASIVLRYIVMAKTRGLAVVLITHNPSHAYPVGDRFTILDRGHSLGTYAKSTLEPVRLLGLMSGGAELEELTHELHDLAKSMQTSTSRPA
ncbi:MAG: sugar ABC transporter ATP-binding protein [Chloroflexi bacterium]|nr:sugar ABC transporter ATP-binding protein [Chloroflexota bacterium]MBV9543371.1 sugar ABC transporter ATP-binding protein [Chloroflexota bacterium]